MYITNTTDKLKEIIEELEEKDDLTKLKFLIYIFGLLNNNQINDKNESNPDFVEDENLKIFNLQAIGMSENANTILLQCFAMNYNLMTDTKDVIEDNGNIIGINYNKYDEEIASKFERLEFEDKLDLFSEIIIRFDNDTYFENDNSPVSLDSNLSGFDIAKRIQEFKIK